MIDYQIPQLSDRAWAEPLLYASGNRGCENNFTNIFVWQKTYGQRIARWRDFVMLRYTQPEAIYHLFPAGVGDPQLAVGRAAAGCGRTRRTPGAYWSFGGAVRGTAAVVPGKI